MEKGKTMERGGLYGSFASKKKNLCKGKFLVGASNACLWRGGGQKEIPGGDSECSSVKEKGTWGKKAQHCLFLRC